MVNTVSEKHLAQGILHVGHRDLKADDVKRILLKLSTPEQRERRPRQCRRLDGVAEILSKLPPATPIWKLNFVGNRQLGDAVTDHLHLIPDSVTDLDLSDCRLTPAGVKNVFVFLKTNTSITRMIMWDNDVGEESCKDLRDMLKVNTTIRELCLMHCNISGEGFTYLSDGLKDNDSLRDFALNGNRLSDKDVQNLCPGLTVNKSLETLDLRHGNISDEGIGYLAEVAKQNCHLKTVNPAFSDAYISTRCGSAWWKLSYYLKLNQLNRKLIHEESATTADWREALLVSADSGFVGGIYQFVRSKPELVGNL